MIKVIFATGINGEFYNKKTKVMPWGEKPLSGDSKHFSDFTRDSVIVMGRNTWESLPFKLKGRHNVVLSHSGDVRSLNGEMPDEICSGDLRQVLNELESKYQDKDIIVIGGMDLVFQALRYAQEVSWTETPYGYKDCECIKREAFLRELDKRNLSMYSRTFWMNEKFGKGSDCMMKIFRKMS